MRFIDYYMNIWTGHVFAKVDSNAESIGIHKGDNSAKKSMLSKMNQFKIESTLIMEHQPLLLLISVHQFSSILEWRLNYINILISHQQDELCS